MMSLEIINGKTEGESKFRYLRLICEWSKRESISLLTLIQISDSRFFDTYFLLNICKDRNVYAHTGRKILNKLKTFFFQKISMYILNFHHLV